MHCHDWVMVESHDAAQATRVSLHDAQWRVTCPSLEHQPLEFLSLPAYPLAALLNAGRVDDPLSGCVRSPPARAMPFQLSCTSPAHDDTGTTRRS